MARGLLAGLTDYSHQSFQDILEDIEDAKKNAIAYTEEINRHIAALDANGNLWKNQPFDFRNIVGYSLKHYETVASECSDIISDIKKRRVEEHHCNRLIKTAEVSQKINVDIGKYWNNKNEIYKNYDDPNFRFIENIYADTRDAAIYFLELENIAIRLTDFIGKTSGMEDKQPSTNFQGAQFGHNTVIVVGDNNVVSPSQVMKNDMASLESLLRSNQVGQEDIDEIKAIVQTENPDLQNGRLGVKANGWIAKMVNKCLDGTWAIGIGAAGKLLADAIKHYYGLFQ